MSRTSPAVRYPVLVSGVLRALWWGITCTGLVATLAWAGYGAGSGSAQLLRGALALLVWAALSAWAWHAWRRMPVGQLSWDGMHWSLETDGPTHRLHMAPTVVMDIQSVLVLVFRGTQGSTLQVVLQKNWQPGRWGDLRRAVYSSAHPPQDAMSSPVK
jgi:hypothetical protein